MHRGIGTCTVAALALALAAATPRPALGQKSINTMVMVAHSMTNPCTGETLAGTGEIHLTFQENVDGSGGVHHSLHLAPKRFRAETITGTKYVSHEDLQHIINTPNPAFTSHNELTWRMVRQAEDGTIVDPAMTGDDFLMHAVIQITISADFIATFDYLNFRQECN